MSVSSLGQYFTTTMETVDLCSSSEEEGSSPRLRIKHDDPELLVCLSSDDECQDGPTDTQVELKYSSPLIDGSDDDISFVNGSLLNSRSSLLKNSPGVSNQQKSMDSDDSVTSKKRRAPPRQPDSDDSSEDDDLENTGRQRHVAQMLARKPLPVDHDDSSSSDDDALFISALRKPLTKDDRSKRKREELEQEKTRRKKASLEERERSKAQKLRAKEQERHVKAFNKDMAKQRAGKFAKEEIAVIVEPSLLETLSACFEQLKNDYGYNVSEYSGLDPGALVFIRRDSVEGGAVAAVDALISREKNGFQFLHHLVVVFADPKKFLDLLDKQDDADDYPKLEEYLNALQQSWKNTWKQPNTVRPKIALLLPCVKEVVNKLWQSNAHVRAQMPKPPPRDFELEDAIMWCSIQFSVDVIPLSNNDQLTDFLQKMIRSISEAPYRNQVTELECIKKIKSDVPFNAAPLERAKDTWERMLLQVPLLSLQRVRNAVSVYPTALSLWNDYQNQEASEAQKEAAIADCLGGKSQQLKISQSLFRLMTSSDPNELL